MSDRTQPNDSRAVSPVIGVVLVVAITVILAATMAPTFFNFGNSISKSAKGAVGVKFNEGTGDGEIQVTYIDRGNTEKLEVRHAVQTNPGSNSVSVVSGSSPLDEPGDTMTLQEDGSNADESIEVQIIVTAFLESDEQAVIYDQTKEI